MFRWDQPHIWGVSGCVGERERHRETETERERERESGREGGREGRTESERERVERERVCALTVSELR